MQFNGSGVENIEDKQEWALTMARLRSGWVQSLGLMRLFDFSHSQGLSGA
jgi:hypothetical protein